MDITNNTELSQALDNKEPDLNIIGHLQFDRDVSLITWPCRITVGENCQLDNIDGSLYCRTDLGTSVCGLNQVEMV